MWKWYESIEDRRWLISNSAWSAHKVSIDVAQHCGRWSQVKE